VSELEQGRIEAVANAISSQGSGDTYFVWWCKRAAERALVAADAWDREHGWQRHPATMLQPVTITEGANETDL